MIYFTVHLKTNHPLTHLFRVRYIILLREVGMAVACQVFYNYLMIMHRKYLCISLRENESDYRLVWIYQMHSWKGYLKKVM